MVMVISLSKEKKNADGDLLCPGCKITSEKHQSQSSED
jgi:hypothetical protein